MDLQHVRPEQLSRPVPAIHVKVTNRAPLVTAWPNGPSSPRVVWDLPVGKSEPGEPITETDVRELKEETSLVVAPGTCTWSM
jgi:8-oxo-dGTP pyrophosphatase MutT (NUDIX family)